MTSGLAPTTPGDTRPTVALIIHDLRGGGGMQRVHAETIRRLSGRYRFIVVANDLEPELLDLVSWVPIRTTGRPAPVRFSIFYLLATLRVARLQVDLVHACGAIMANRADLVTVHFCHAGFRQATGGLAPAGAPGGRTVNTTVQRWLALMAERWSYRSRRTRTLAAVSSRVQTELDQHYPNARVIVTANGVDVDVFEHDLGTRKAIRTGQGAEPSDVVALFVGGDWDRKGLALAIESVAEARQSGASMHLWVLGTGDTERFRRHATEQGVADLVTFVGHHQDTAGWYQAADVYLCCSLYEAFSLAMIEAAATALPVVSTLVGGAAEIVTGNDEGSERGGVIVERNAAVIGDVLARLAADPSERGRLGRIAQRRASGFDWDRLAEQTDQVYQDLLNASSRTSDRTA